MKVVSRLVNMDFKIGKMLRKDDQLVISSHESQPMKVKVYMSPEDITGFIRAALNWSVISYVLSLPFVYLKQKMEN
jgi:hypothetical protein